jgi:solute:Na+ symporter, SSS family
MFLLASAAASTAPQDSLPALLAFSAEPLAHLRTLDVLVIALYFAMVLCIGFYLKGRSNTSE